MIFLFYEKSAFSLMIDFSMLQLILKKFYPQDK